METGDFIAWRYHEDNNINKTITRFGIIQEIETFHYIIKDIETGQILRVIQSFIAIVYNKKYNKLYTLDKNKLYTRDELDAIFGKDTHNYSDQKLKNIYIDIQNNSDILK